MRRFLSNYGLGLMAATTILPGALASCIGTLYITQLVWSGWLNSNGLRAVLFGGCAGVLLWLLAGLAYRGLGEVDSASAGTYGELCEELDRIEPRLAAVPADATPTGERAQADRQLDFLHGALGYPHGTPSTGRQWLLAHGYVDAWRRIHRIQEAVILFDDKALVLSDALSDELRLMSSQILQRAELLERLRRAVQNLGDGAGAYLCEPPSAAGVDPSLDPAERAGQARAALRQVRYAINDYRDARRDGIVRARNNIFATALFTGATATLLLVIAILAGASPTEIAAAAAFYLVGAIVGLFRQLRMASSQHTATDDFGLSSARMLQTPLFSGIAAVGGVVLTSMLSAVIPVPGATGETTVGNVPSLSSIFDLASNPTSLIIAGVFGLTPTLLIARLQQQAERYKSDLSSSEAAGKSAPAGP